MIFFSQAGQDVFDLFLILHRKTKCKEPASFFTVYTFCRIFQGFVRIIHGPIRQKKTGSLLNLFELEFEFLFYFFYLCFKLLIGFNQVIDGFAGMQYGGMVLSSNLRTNRGKR